MSFVRTGSVGACAVLVFALITGCAPDDHARAQPAERARQGLEGAQPSAPPSWGGQQKITANDGVTNDQLGAPSALTADRALVSAPLDDNYRGAAYVFARSGTTFTQEQKLVASDGAARMVFGGSAALTADRAMLGSSDGWGSAYVFARSGTTWTEEQKLLPSDNTIETGFGGAVALTADRAVIGGSRYNSFLGAAYVFVRSGTTWTEEQKLLPSDRAAPQSFGGALAMTADRILIGAPSLRDGLGAAYVFVRNGTTWTEEQKLVASDGTQGATFGVSVSLTPDRALIGAYMEASDPMSVQPTGRGAAYVFVRNGTTWTEERKLTASDGEPFDLFGYSVALIENGALIGAYGDDAYRGAAYFFRREGTTWTEQQKLTASDGVGNDHYGASVALTAGYALAGATWDNLGRGSAYLFRRDVPDGDPCTGDGDCTSGHCADERCCEEACDGVCEACSARAKGSGQDGVCEQVNAGTECAPGTCSGTTRVDASTCNAAGACVEGASAACPPGTVCGTSGGACVSEPDDGSAGAAGAGGDGAGGDGAGGDGAGGDGAGGSTTGGSGGAAGSAMGGNAMGGNPTAGTSVGGSAGNVAGAAGRGGSGPNPNGGDSPSEDSGCDCHIAAARSSSGSWLLTLVALVGLGFRRRARRW
jgi:MYXO-CTERM domain-containing protein